MNKTNSVEIIAILYLIAGLLCHNWFHWVLFFMAVENTIESMVYAFKDGRKEKLAKAVRLLEGPLV